MADYEVVADIGNALVRILAEEMDTGMLGSPDQISLCAPRDRGGAKLGIWLFSIEEHRLGEEHEPIYRGEKKRMLPPMYLELHYMLTAWSDSRESYRAGEEQKLLARTLQILRDFPVYSLEKGEFQPADGGGNPQVELELMNLEERNKVAGLSGETGKTFLVYRVSPVPLDSRRNWQTVRVRELKMQTEEK